MYQLSNARAAPGVAQLFSAIISFPCLSFSSHLRRYIRFSPIVPLFSRILYLSDVSSPLRPPLMANTTSNAAAATTPGGVDGDRVGGQESSVPNSFSMETQFERFRSQMEESGHIRDRIRSVVSEMEPALRVVHASLLLVHQSLPLPEVLMKVNAQIVVLRDLYKRLAEIVRECPGQYYRYHCDWRGEIQTTISLLAFSHWLETGKLLTLAEAEDKLGLNSSELFLDIEDYLTGLCFMSNELPRYVVNQVTAGDFDCPRNVLKFLTELHSSFQMLNFRNDFLRKKFDGLKYDVRRVEEVYYDVKIRGLSPRESPP